MAKEASARIKINKLLEEAGWRFFDNDKGKANILLESHTKITQKDLDEFGNDFDRVKHGFLDFLLVDDKNFPLLVLEAKSEDKNPLDGKEQARAYAKSKCARFIILSNGNLHYFWDLKKGNPYVITKIPTLESISFHNKYEPNTEALINEQVDNDYIAITQKHDYKSDPRWLDENDREDYIKDNKLHFLRDYQVRAVKSLQRAVKEGKDRFLFEMATGTGKTLVSAAIIKLFLRSGNAKRVLFLVDRIELEDQAEKAFKKYLKNDFATVIYKEKKNDWHKAEIVVSTVQSLMFDDKYNRLFSPTDFDLVISDEAHRSISGDSRALFEYFTGYKLGLTATPKDYLKKIEKRNLEQQDPRELERRHLLDTYITFGCESGNPTFRYSLVDGAKDGFLINPIVADARTEITTELLSEEGYTMSVENEEGKTETQKMFQRDFERKFFSEETNKIFCKTFLENAFRDEISKEIGKTIVFCVSQNHASKITQILNQFADKMFSNKYNSDFAVQVTSSIKDSQQHTINFSNNKLNGYTNFLEGYKSSRTRVCVTVGMMTTGYDCQDILNLCLMRPIFSPTEFIQIKGRGTRTFKFEYADAEGGKAVVDKKRYKLFDFFANCEYFEEKYNYDEVLKLPVRTSGKTIDSREQVQLLIKEFENFNPDPLKDLKEIEVGTEGMKVDRMFFDVFEETIKNDLFIAENYENNNLEAIEEYIKENVFDKPEEYYSLEKLRKALKLDRRISLREIVEKIFGRIDKFKTKDELLEEEFNKFVSIYKPDSEHVIAIKNFIKAYITDSELRDIIEKRELARLSTNAKVTMADYRALNGWKDIIPEYIKSYVSLNKFM